MAHTGLKPYERADDVFTVDWTVRRTAEEAGFSVSVRYAFTLGRPVSAAWTHFKDFSLWLSDLQYDAVVGDVADDTVVSFSIARDRHEHYRTNYGIDPATFRKALVTRFVVPERLIVHEELSADGKDIIATYVVALSEHGGVTDVSGLMAYAPVWRPISEEAQEESKNFALRAELTERWKTHYIPTLRRLVEGG